MTPEEWARVAMNNAVKFGGMAESIADAIRRAIAEEREHVIYRALTQRQHASKASAP